MDLVHHGQVLVWLDDDRHMGAAPTTSHLAKLEQRREHGEHDQREGQPQSRGIPTKNLLELSFLPADLPSEALWARLADTSRGLTGSDAALILRDEMDQSRTPVAVMAASGLATANFPTFERSDLVSLLAAAGNDFERLVENAGPIRAAIARSSGGRFFEAISLPGDGHLP